MDDGDKMRRAAYVIAQAAIFNAKIAGMQAENQARAHRGEAPAYDEKAFVDEIDASLLHHNAVTRQLWD